MTVSGVLLVMRQEFRVRLRTGRWRWLLGVWVAVLALFTMLLYVALTPAGIPDGQLGIPLFGGLMLFVLALVLIISPALTAQSINGDRERGTLATLQVTRLSPMEITLGKLLAGWGVGLTALALALPFVGLSMLAGGVGPVRAVAVLVVTALLIGVVCALSQAWSALVARSITSALLSYVTVFALTIGTLITFALTLPLVSPDNGRQRTDRVWWLLAPNPFVVLADAAPALPPQRDRYGYDRSRDYDPLGGIGRGVRSLRDPDRDFDDPGGPPVWPYGLGFDLLLGAGAVWLTARRLRMPARTLPRGTRVA